MRTKSHRSLRSWRRPGLTLLEVVAGLTLLATLLVGTILAYGSHIRQVKLAQKRLAAIEIADQLLVDWYETTDGPPLRDEDVVEDTDGWRWRTTPLPNADKNPFRARIVRFEIYDPREGVEPDPLVYVDLLMPEEDEAESRAEGDNDE